MCVQIKATPGVVRCMGRGSCVNLNPGLLSHSFRAVHHNMYEHYSISKTSPGASSVQGGGGGLKTEEGRSRLLTGGGADRDC